jgi:tRNA uridine 5-carboxymethylaminomethyl modification enzyme
MFTSRAEFRILLRQDNADLRLSQKGYDLGLLSERRYNDYTAKYDQIDSVKKNIVSLSAIPDKVNPYLEENKSSSLKQKTKYDKLIARPNVTIEGFASVDEKLSSFIKELDRESLDAVEIDIKYEGYIKREKEVAEKMRRLEDVKIPVDMDFRSVNSLSSEAKEKLSNIKPATIGEASRISGVSPSDVSVLLVAVGR